MMPEDLPYCICKEAKWGGHGGSFGGLSQSNFKCKACDRFAVQIAGKGGNILMIIKEPGEGLPEKTADWFNGKILGVWRDAWDKHKAKIKEHEKMLVPFYAPVIRDIAARQLADMGAGGPLGMKVFPLLKNADGDHAVLLRALRKTIGQWEPNWRPRIKDPDAEEGEYKSIEDPESPDRMVLLKKFAEHGNHEEQAQATAILRALEARKQAKKNNWYQEGFPEVPIPPQVPGDEVVVYVHRPTDHGWVWEHIDPDKTQNLEIPPDPIRVYHDALYEEIFKETGLSSSPRAEIPNGYYSDKFKNEPWYEFEINGFKLTVGPRKRVISITLQRDEEFEVLALKALGERDGVTYTANDGWKSDLKVATSANLHAWGKEKAIEYIKAMLEVTSAANV